MAYEIVRIAIAKGYHPDQIRAVINGPRRWFHIDGEVSDEEEFIRLAMQKYDKFDHTRYFTGKGELFVLNGETYALSNQWGATTVESVEGVLNLMGDSSVSYRVSSA